jgi:putative SOS response-associated peptidase YedK
MCGRYSLTTDLDRLLPRLRGPLPAGLVAHYAPRAEVRPGEPVLLQRQEHGRPQVALALWGLLPEWSRDGRLGRRPINARSETVASKPFFRGAWRHRRCLLPADGFYEWSDRARPGQAGGRRRPWWIRRRDGAPFWLGGIWDRWLAADASEVESCCVLTTAPNDLLRPLHDRMPVLIPDGLEEAWMAGTDAAGLRALEPLMAPWDPAGWEAVPLERLPGAAAAAGSARLSDGADG